jgi:hypothetical protein
MIKSMAYINAAVIGQSAAPLEIIRVLLINAKAQVYFN